MNKTIINKSKKPNMKIPIRKKILFLFFIFFSLFLLLTVFELSLRLFDYGENLDLFVPYPDENSEYLGINLNIGQRYYYYYGNAFDPTPQKDLFLKEKPNNAFRIFVLGASTTAGFPYQDNISFPRFLHTRLANTFPDKKIEVINTAITSVNSYTLLDFMDEIIEQQPDLILIYAGHNEFFGPFGPVSGIQFGKYPWMAKTVLFLQRFKTFILFRDIINPLVGKLNKSIEINQTESNINPSFYKNTNISLNSDNFKLGLKQFTDNISDIVQKADDSNIPVIISEIVSNIKEIPPFPNTIKEDRAAALSTYNSAKVLYTNENYLEARKKFYQAKDLDPIRFRAPEAFNDAIHSIGKKYDIMIVPMKSLFERASKNGIPGNNIFLEHVHPKKEGYSLMANAFYKTMKTNKIISENWPPFNKPNLEKYGFTKLDSIYANLVVLNLKSGWPFSTKSFSTKLLPEAIKQQFFKTSPIDSLAAVAYTQNDYSLQDAHIELANYYKTIGKTELAFKEYKTLIYSIPGIDISYKDALNLLIDTKQYMRARELLLTAVKFNPSAYIFKSLGQVNLALFRIADAISSFEKSIKIKPEDKQVLRNFIRAYYTIGEYQKGDSLLNEYKTSTNDFSGIKGLEEFRESMRLNSKQAFNMFQSAMKSYNKKQIKLSMDILQKSLKKYQSSSANLVLGKIMLKTNNIAKAIELLERSEQLSLEHDPSLLNSLCIAYIKNENFVKAQRTITIFERYFPASADLAYLKSSLKTAR
ncbi:MAG: hypothetical protein D8M58_05190 [Calditrichaeota bacterium]|nr:MAG: hypothetical protein DWQ03_01885 [Calditrichota bacterium]MBL1204769.1 hypothetical protein [Calditrichota bacterium]NOG44597.1 hypothetical protein [Calditrichota bacterium]